MVTKDQRHVDTEVAAPPRPIRIDAEEDRTRDRARNPAFVRHRHRRRRLLQLPVHLLGRQAPRSTRRLKNQARYGRGVRCGCTGAEEIGETIAIRIVSRNEERRVYTVGSGDLRSEAYFRLAQPLTLLIEVDRDRAGRAEILRKRGNRVIRRSDAERTGRSRMSERRGRILPLAHRESVVDNVFDVLCRPTIDAPDHDLIVSDVGTTHDVTRHRDHLRKLESLIGFEIVVSRIEHGRRGVGIQPITILVKDIDVVVGLHSAYVERLVPLEVENGIRSY